jgi:hypothetical protein
MRNEVKGVMHRWACPEVFVTLEQAKQLKFHDTDKIDFAS